MSNPFGAPAHLTSCRRLRTVQRGLHWIIGVVGVGVLFKIVVRVVLWLRGEADLLPAATQGTTDRAELLIGFAVIVFAGVALAVSARLAKQWECWRFPKEPTR